MFLATDGESYRPLSEFEVDVVESVAFIFDSLSRDFDFMTKMQDENLFYIFVKHFSIINDLTYSEVNEIIYHDEVNLAYFQFMRIRLLDFQQWVRGGNWFWTSKTELLTRIFGLFTPLTLRYLTYEDKINILSEVLIDNWYISGRWNPFLSEFKLTEEELLVKIVQCIAFENEEGLLNYSEINNFMDLLNSQPYFSPTTNPENLYQLLYLKIHDPILFGDDGNGARGLFVKAVYLLWMNSRYNPGISESIVSDENIVSYKYVPRDLENQYLHVSTLPSPTTPSPFLINYESDKFLLWYLDNFKFEFHEQKIKAIIKDSTAEVLLSATPAKWVYDDYYSALFGYYDVFQPISVANQNDQNTIIKIPVIFDPGNPCAITDENNANMIPIFYLKYIDDLSANSNLKQSIGTFIDVVLTFTGIGNITKFRHLLKVSVIRRYLAGGATRAAITLAEKALTMRAIRGLAFASWEILIGVVNSVHNLVSDGCTNYLSDPCNIPEEGTPEYEDFETCQAVQGWLFAIELITLSGDVLARRFLRSSSQTLAPRLPADFPLIQKNIIDTLADLAPDYHDFRLLLSANGYDNILTKLDEIEAAFGIKKCHDIMLDFKSHSFALKTLNNKPELLDEWLNVIDHFAHHRKNIFYLEALKRFSDKPHEVFHITDFFNKSTTGGFKELGAHGGKNLTNGVLQNPDLPPPIGKPYTFKLRQPVNGHTIYRNIYFIKPNGELKRKAWQTIWNPLWDDARIKGEMAFAYMNRTLTRPPKHGINIPGHSPPPQTTSIFKSFLSDGTEVEITILNFGKDPITGIIQEDYLKYFLLKI